jgi:mono/diheme cytochrome c family protein
MRSSKLALLVLVFVGVILFGVAAITVAAPGQKKKPAKPAPGASKTLIAEGKKVYDSSGCAACHMIGNKGGKVGPNLTHVGKTTKPAKLETVIRTPKKLNPKGMMPAYDAKKINAKQLKALVAYLSSLK